jgi:hypothetical protein
VIVLLTIGVVWTVIFLLALALCRVGAHADRQMERR